MNRIRRTLGLCASGRWIGFWLLLLGGGLVVRNFGAEPHPSLPQLIVPECFGVNIHFTAPQPGELEMLAAAGFKWVRMDLHWADTEQQPGVYDFSAYDGLVAALEKHGLRALFILDYGNPHYADPGDQQPFTTRAGTPGFRAAFARWAVAAVSRFKGRGYIWELWNEPNQAGFWKPKPNPADYVALVKTTGDALRKAELVGSKGEAFIGPATSTIDLPFLEACFKAGLLDYWDAVSVHPYRHQAPETVEEEYRLVRLLIHEHAPPGKTIPLVSSEWGYSHAWEKSDPEIQGRYLPRQFLTNVANDVVLSIWYDWRDDGTNPKEPEHHFGVVGHDYHAGRDPVFDPKPGYTAMRNLTEQLSGFRFNKSLTTERTNQSVLLFSRGDDTRLVARNLDPAEIGDVSFPAGDGTFTRTGILGNSLPTAVAKDGVLKVQFDAGLQFLAPDDPDDRLRIAAAWDRAPVSMPVLHGTPGAIVLDVRNPLTRPVRVGAANVSPGGTVQLRATVPSSRIDQVREVISKLDFTLDGQPASFTQRTRFISGNPLTLVRYPQVDQSIPVRVLNPTGDSFEGSVVLGTTSRDLPDSIEKERVRIPVRLAAGAREQLVKVPVGRETEDFTLHVSLQDAENRRLDGGGVNKELPITLVAAQLQAFSEGGPGAKVEHQFTDAAPPEGTPFPGMPSVRLTYRFEPGWSYLRLTAPPQPLGTARELGVWIHGDGRGAGPRMRFRDQTGQVFQPSAPAIDWKGWRYVTFPLQPTAKQRLEHWDGANDGVIHYPVEWDSVFLLDNLSRQTLEGEIYLCAPTLIY